MILFADDFNFARQNYVPLYSMLERENIAFEYDQFENQGLKKCFGDYSSHSAAVDTEYQEVSNSNEDRGIFEYDVDGHVLYPIYKLELLSSIADTDVWQSSSRPRDDSEIQALFLESYFADVRRAVGASSFWIKHWRRVLVRKKYSAVVTFGNSLIYTRALAQVAKNLGVRCFVLEHFFTGNEFYFEERYTEIQNNSILRHPHYLRSLGRCSGNSKYDPILKYEAAKNKNVKQPPFRREAFFENDEPTVLLLCQVVNDFAVVSEANPFKSSVAFYRELLGKLLDNTGLNVIVKTHPYECKKTRSRTSYTFESLERFLTDDYQDSAGRVALIESYNLGSLIQACDFAVTLTSQAGLEVLMHGKPLITFGGAFFAKHGFTHDFDSIDEAIDFIASWSFDLEHLQQKALVDYLARCFRHLITNDLTDETKARSILSPEASPLMFGDSAGRTKSGRRDAHSKYAPWKLSDFPRLLRADLLVAV
jgi:hypothetical protein